MATREKLHELLCELLGSRNVYYDPPATVKMQYDAIRYSKKKPDVKFANDKRYKNLNCYEIIVIARKPDHPVIEKILDLPYASYDRHYPVDNLHHDVITLYY